MNPEAMLLGSARAMLQSLRDRRVSSEELVRAHLDRIEAVNPSVNAVVALAAERALDEARALDAALARGETPGPLHGLPLTIKDSHDTEGIVTTWGTTGRRELVPSLDSPPVARLRQAGAVVIGKTNTPELTLSFVTDNDVYGLTRNPWDTDRSAGGSSGGAAAALAVGATALELGSDLGGSIRVPAAFCGVAGLKPTVGRVTRTRHALPWGGPLDSFGTIGPMARTVGDLALMLPIIAGSDGIDPGVIDRPIVAPLQSVAGLRVAVQMDNGRQVPSDDIRAAVHLAAGVLEDAGAEVEHIAPDAFEQAWDLSCTLFAATGGPLVAAMLADAGTAAPSRFLSGHMLWAQGFSADELVAVLHQIDVCRSKLRRFLLEWDVLLGPIAAWTAPTHDEADSLDYGYGYPHNLSGCPAVVVPAGLDKGGLPIGVQVAAGPWREHVALGAAAAIEEGLGGFAPPPLLAG